MTDLQGNANRNHDELSVASHLSAWPAAGSQQARGGKGASSAAGGVQTRAATTEAARRRLEELKIGHHVTRRPTPRRLASGNGASWAPGVLALPSGC